MGARRIIRNREPHCREANINKSRELRRFSALNVMKSSIRAVCSSCSFTAEFVWPMWALYQWPDGATLEIAQQVVWCWSCQSVRVAEALPILEHIERLQRLPVFDRVLDGGIVVWPHENKAAILAYVRYPRLAHLHDYLVNRRRFDAAPLVVMQNALALHRAWRVARTSPPRCLTCGDTEFLPWPVDAEGEPQSGEHPECFGHITFSQTLKSRVPCVLWSIEGEPIGRR